MLTKTFGDKKLTIEALGSKDLKCAKEYMDFINCLVAENAKILTNEKQTLKQQLDYVKSAVKQIKERKGVYLIAKDRNRVVANTSLEIQPYRRSHIAKFGIGIRDGYRGIGLGKYIMAKVIELGKKQLKPAPKILQLEVYENNKPAMALYKKMGFKIVGKIPKQIQYKGKLIGEYIMIKEVK